MDAPLLLDLIVGLVIVGRAVVGMRNGFLVGSLSLFGVLAGAAGGVWAGLWLVDQVPTPDQSRLFRTVTLLVVSLIGIALGEAVLGSLARRIRGHDRAKGFDAFLGGLSAAVVAGALVWFLLGAIRPFAPEFLSSAIGQSRVYHLLDVTVPDRFNELPGRAADVLVKGLPKVFGGDEPQLPTHEPDGTVLGDPRVQQAASGVVQVQTLAPNCRSDSAGSGWVVSDQRVVTNAHVVAGSSTVGVSVTGTGPLLDAQVVAFDPDLDLAILAVPALEAAPLPRAPESQPQGADAIAAGFPWGGPFSLSESRIRGTVVEEGADIFGGPGIAREVYAIRGVVRPGNSGGPLLTVDGRVAGTVFAMSAVDDQTGYVLTDAATAPMLDQAAALADPVPTGACLTR